MVKGILNFKYIKAKSEEKFDHFFQNSYVHYFLRQSYLRDFDDDLKYRFANQYTETILGLADFIVGVDPIDENVFYCYTAYTISGSDLVIFHSYVKRKFRRFGFAKAMLNELGADLSSSPKKISTHAAYLLSETQK